MEWIDALQVLLLGAGVLVLLALAVALVYLARILRSVAIMAARFETISNWSHWWRVLSQSSWLTQRLKCVKK